MAYDSSNQIQQAFLEGMEEVFSIMFTNNCKLYLLDSENTETNIYGETKSKKYSEPYDLVAKITYNHSKGESPEETTIRSATIRVPTKQFLDKGIPCLLESDWEMLKKSKFEYEGCTYLVDNVTPMTLVSDIWQFFDFNCTEDKKKSIK